MIHHYNICSQARHFFDRMADVYRRYAVFQRERFEMAVVDFAVLDGELDAESVRQMRELTEQLATQRNMLLMLCGNEGDALEEIWARQLGVWLYLPGIREQNDVQALCSQALPVAERLAGRQRELVG